MRMVVWYDFHMKSACLAAIFICPSTNLLQAADISRPITDIPALISCLTNVQQHTYFDITGVVVYSEAVRNSRVAIQDQNSLICCWNHTNPEVFPSHGDVVRLTGVTGIGSRGPCADCYNIEILGHGQPVIPKKVSAEELSHKNLANTLVSVSGTITDALHDQIDAKYSFFMLNCRGVAVCAAIQSPELSSAERNSLIGATVSVTGICRGHNGPRWAVKNILFLDSPRAITILAPPADDPFSADPVDQTNLFAPNPVSKQKRRQASGTVITTWGKNNVLLRTDSCGLIKVELSANELPANGERILVVGYPETDLYSVILVHALWRRDTTQPPIPAAPARKISARDLFKDNKDRPRYDFASQGTAVSLQGIVRGLPSSGNPDQCLYVESDGCIIVVDAEAAADAVATLQLGSTIEVSGVCVLETNKIGINYLIPRITGVRLVINDANGIRLLAAPPWWTSARIMSVIGMLLAAIIAVLIWNRALKLVADRRGKELYRLQIAQKESELRIDERTRLATELHDYIAQSLTAVSYKLSAAKDANALGSKEFAGILENAMRTLQSCRIELRRCLWDLRNNALSNPDLADAIRRTVAAVAHGVAVSVHFPVPRPAVSDTTTHAVLSILRELVSNAVQHGKPHEVHISGELADDTLRFTVTDDGSGFDPATLRGQEDGHFGLSGIAERVERLGGTFEINSSPGTGTKAVVAVHMGGDGKKRVAR